MTAGSCFAAHLGQSLLNRGMNWLDTEPPPPGLSASERSARQYGLFSFRTGNIYTAASLRQWVAWALGENSVPEQSWLKGQRHFDPYRPSIEPDGYPSLADMLAARQATITRMRRALGDAQCLIFTLGLTEGWLDAIDDTVYPMCPGTLHGTFEPGRHVFHNYSFAEIHSDLTDTIDCLNAVNTNLRVVLTVSPVPLTATATGQHALVASTYSKSVLRAVAGQLAMERTNVDYFPSYELVTGSPFRGRFFAPNLRTVTPEGVAFVMRQFVDGFSGIPAGPAIGAATRNEEDAVCDDEILDYYRSR
ncbi:GSCFA domain-containing protein [Micromonospora sp. NPDC005172]|uniref:GSCFA domain-containing protein n=1 Tax=Micromonospora sp. NPDC005172 TaxID=3156867 RepID=UPI0033BA630F